MEKITQTKIKNYIDDLPYTFEIFESIDSTNTYAKKIIVSESIDKKVIIAESQTKGRGRVGREFYSPANNGIYMSIILKTDSFFSDINLLTVAVAVATLKAIEKVTGLKSAIKWVNDIFINNKKICGILCENIIDYKSGKISHSVIGIGINVKTTDFFPENIKNIAGALMTEELDRNELIAEILKNIYNISQSVDFAEYLEDYLKESLVLHKNISFNKDGCEYIGKVVNITDSGNLEVELKDKRVIIIKSGVIRLDINSIC